MDQTGTPAVAMRQSQKVAVLADDCRTGLPRQRPEASVFGGQHAKGFDVHGVVSQFRDDRRERHRQVLVEQEPQAAATVTTE